jgi:hypothetical protein
MLPVTRHWSHPLKMILYDVLFGLVAWHEGGSSDDEEFHTWHQKHTASSASLAMFESTQASSLA